MGLPGKDLGAVGVAGGCGNGGRSGVDDAGGARLLGVKRGTALPGVDGIALPGVSSSADTLRDWGISSRNMTGFQRTTAQAAQ